MREEKWRGDVFAGYSDDDVMFEIATHSANGRYPGCAYVEEDGRITGIVTALPLDITTKQIFIRNILCTTRHAFRKLVDVVHTAYGPEWTLLARREGKLKVIGKAKRFNNLVKG